MINAPRRLKADAALRGLNGRDIARRAGVSEFVVSRVVNGGSVHPAKLARVLRAIYETDDAA